MVTHLKGRVKKTKNRKKKYIKNTQNDMTYCTTLRGYGRNTSDSN